MGPSLIRLVAAGEMSWIAGSGLSHYRIARSAVVSLPGYGRLRGSEAPTPVATYAHRPAGVAQSVEQLIRNQQVIGSSPIAGSNPPHKFAHFGRWSMP
jgi:hypothetical protein